LGQSAEPTIDTSKIYPMLIEDTLIAEKCGYDGAWFAEHHFSNYAIVPNSLTLIAAISREARKIRLGTSIILLPLRNPIYVAEEIAMVDQLCEGRLEVGFGRGYQPYEFNRLGVDFASAGARLVEGCDFLTHLFTKLDAPYSSPNYSVPGVTVVPSPRQLPHPPFWLACGSPESMGVALDRGMSIVANVGNNGPQLAERVAEMFKAACKQRGIDPRSVRFAMQTHGYLVEGSEDEDTIVRSGGYLHRVQKRLREKRESMPRGINDASGSEAGEPTFEGWSSASLIGSPAHIVKQIDRFKSLGVTDLFITYRYGYVTTEGTRKSIEFIANAMKKSNQVARPALAVGS
jgi:alkanesulfonate monooxygenase SsuD/methylene tetrahydromethanopterin reductase-like flavin-dependent oxidoreductase (luciferase family)